MEWGRKKYDRTKPIGMPGSVIILGIILWSISINVMMIKDVTNRV
jgi:hypothetical protein